MPLRWVHFHGTGLTFDCSLEANCKSARINDCAVIAALHRCEARTRCSLRFHHSCTYERTELKDGLEHADSGNRYRETS